MKIQGRDLFVGLFVLGAIGVLFYFSILTRGSDVGETVSVVAYFDDVQLLEKKSPVTVGGVLVGYVEDVRPEEAGPETFRVTVEFGMRKDVAARLKQGTTASIEAQSFLGGKFLKIAPVFDGADLETDGKGRPIVGTLPGGGPFAAVVNDVMGRLDPVLIQAQQLLVRLNDVVLTKENTDSLFTLVNSTRGTMDELKTTLADVKQRFMREGGTADKVDALLKRADDTLVDLDAKMSPLFEKASGTLTNLDKTLARADKTLGKAGDLVETTKTTVTRLDGDLRPRMNRLLEQSTTTMEKVQRRIDPTFDNLDGTLVTAQDLMSDQDLRGAFYEMRLTLQELRLLARSLRANPSQLIFGGPGDTEGKIVEPSDEKGRRLSGRARRYGY